MSELTGCNSHSCFIAPPKGMGHNGPCRCVDHRGQRYINQLRARLTDTERQLREAQKRCERLEVLCDVSARVLRNRLKGPRWTGGKRTGEAYTVNTLDMRDLYLAWFAARTPTPEPDEMTQAMQEGKV